jgi:antitoxin (DNA-binding transcriptional repressor) of toxin-antitoxin stability system
MVTRLSVAQVKAHLSEVLRQVERGDEIVVVERRGRPVAIIKAWSEKEDPPAHWLDSVLGICADVPNFLEVMEQVVASREDYPPRPVSFG